MLNKFWYPIANGQSIHTKPFKAQLLGEPLVLFRNSFGKVSCFKDLCPHRNAPLSLGAVKKDRLVCGYHGWEFNSSTGNITHIPTLPDSSPKPRKCLQPFPCIEKDGSVWVSLSPEASVENLKSWPDLPGYSRFELVTTVKAPVVLVLENFVDCAHTPFVHKGLFRSPGKQVLEVTIQETPQGVLINNIGEKTQKSVLSALLDSSAEDIYHTDEYLYPSTVKVDYKWGQRRHICTVSICVPQSANETLIFSRVYLKSSFAQKLTLGVVKSITRKILKQDVVVLEGQAVALAKEGKEHYTGVVSDAPIAWVRRAYKNLEAGQLNTEPHKTLQISYQI